MTQSAFLRALERALRGLSRAERDEALRYYREYFSDAGLDPECDVTALVGTPEDCARNILAELLEQQEPSVKTGAKTLRLVLLGVLAAPVALPVAILAAVAVVVVFAAFAAMFVVGVGLAVSGLALLPTSFWANAAGQGLIVFGVGLVLLGCGVLICVLSLRLWQTAAAGIARLFRRKERV